LATVRGSLFLLFLSLLITSACSTKPHVVKQTQIEVSGPKVVFIVREGWHTGIVVPSGTIESRLPQLRGRFPKTPYIEFGWGDKAYYQAEEINSGLTVKAVFWPTESVVRAVPIPERPDIYFADNEVEVLCLDQEQYALLISFIEGSFHKDSEGNIVESQNGAEGDSQFYQAEGTYYLFNTCNNWTAKALKSAGLEISPAFKMTAGSTMSFLSRRDRTFAGKSCE